MEKTRLLVVDDEREFLDLFVKRFRMRGLAVDGVDNGSAALEALRAAAYDVVVLDLKMPGMDGLETLREIKKHWPRTEVIMLTGHGSVQSGVEGMSLGAYDYVLKPFAIDELLEKILKAHEHRTLAGKS